MRALSIIGHPDPDAGWTLDAWLPILFRWLVVATQAATIILTWQLWNVRRYPPLLPAVSLPQFDIGWLMLVSLAVVLVAPRAGLAFHAGVALLAMLQDQTRIQPEIISSCFLMLGTLSHPAARLIGRMHLVSLWFFSGFHKLLSPAYYAEFAPWIWNGLLPADFKTGGIVLAAIVAVVEMSLGILAFIPRTRRVAAVLAVPFHLGVLVSLVRLNTNSAVWPWNIALAGAGFGLVFSWKTSLRVDLAAVRPSVAAIALFVLLSPCLYYVGLMDAYLAHCLYSYNVPSATIKTHAETGEALPDIIPLMVTYETLNVPLPPTHRTFAAYFRAVGKPGDTMTITDSRWCARLGGYAERVIVLEEK